MNREVGVEPGKVGFNGVAVELSTGDVYVDDATSVARRGPFQAPGVNPEVEPGGNPLIERFGEGQLVGAVGVVACGVEASCRGGVAVSSRSGRVYVVVGPGSLVVEVVLEPPAVPLVSGESAMSVASSSASLVAEVNPRSDPGEKPTSYWFEYVSEEQFAREGFAGAARVPAPAPGLLAASYDASTVSVPVVGLSPGTAYRYRLVAENQISRAKHEPVEGEARSLTTQRPGGFSLLDGRAWEMVSSPVKLGALFLGLRKEFTIQAAASGGALTYVASAPTEDGAAGNSGVTQVFSSRAAGGGWGSLDLALPHERAVALTEGPEYPLFSEDLSSAGVQPWGKFVACTPAGAGGPSCLSGEASEQTGFLRTDFSPGTSQACVSSCYRPLATVANTPEGTVFGVREGAGSGVGCPPGPVCGPQIEAASPDLSHVVVNSRVELAEGAGKSPEGLFEWSAGAWKFLGRGQVGAGKEGAAITDQVAGARAVSTDGSRVILKGESGGLRGLLLRDSSREETVQLGGLEAVFLSASADDSRVFFTNEHGGPLQECAIVEVEEKLRCNASGKPLDLTGGQSIHAPLPGVSEDGSYVYFASDAVLTGGEQNAQGETAVPGVCPGSPPQACSNLYVLHEGATRLVAVLAAADSPDWGKDGYLNAGQIRQSALALSHLTARVSPDGGWLAFMSERSLTGYDNRDAVSGQPDEEVFLYDARSGRVVCGSCSPTGGRPARCDGG